MVEAPMRFGKMPLIPRHILVLALFLAADILFYAPPAGWRSSMYFGDGQDSVAFMWFINWWAFALSRHLPLLHSYYADWPAGTDLAWKTSAPALGILLAPLTRLFGAVAMFNALMLAAPALSAWGVYGAACELVREFVPALLAGVLFLVSGYEMGQSLGHLDLSFVAALPLAVGLVLRAARRGWPGWRLALWLGPVLAFQGGVSQEILASAGLFGGFALALLWAMAPGARARLRLLLPGLAGAGALAVLLLSPLLVAMLRDYHAGQQTLSNPADYGNDLLAPFIPTPLSLWGGQVWAPVTALFKGNDCEQGGYFSLPLLLLLAWAMRRGGVGVHLCGAMFAAALMAAWGPLVFVHGVKLTHGPWALFVHLPVFSAMLPCRFSLYGWLAASFAVALWLRGAGRGRFAVVLLCLALLAPAQSRDRNWRAFALPPVFAQVPARAHVLVLPLFGREMGWQMLSGMKFTLVGQGYLGTGRPAPFNAWALYEPLWEAQYGRIPPAAFAAYLAHFGVDNVVVLNSGYDFFRPGIDERAAAAAARALLAQAGWVSRDAALFAPGIRPDAASMAREMAAQTVDVVALVRRAHALRREARNICVLRGVAARMHMPAGALERVYGWVTVTPIPPAAIRCGPR